LGKKSENILQNLRWLISVKLTWYKSFFGKGNSGLFIIEGHVLFKGEIITKIGQGQLLMLSNWTRKAWIYNLKAT
jgi:hypothetical protein